MTNYHFEKQPELEWAIPGRRMRKEEKHAKKIKKSSPTQIPVPQMRPLYDLHFIASLPKTYVAIDTLVKSVSSSFILLHGGQILTCTSYCPCTVVADQGKS